MSTSKDENFISGIYNHCDRWCERCRFTDRCRLFAMEQERGVEVTEFDAAAFTREMKGIFAETKELLLEAAEKWGIDPYAVSDEEFAELRQREKQFLDGEEVTHLADSYWRPAKEILEDESLKNMATEDESLAEALSVLTWFLFFIPVNVKSALHALLDDDGFEDKDQALDSQSYANGSAKSALLAIDRSVLAWIDLSRRGEPNRVQPLIDLLETIRTKMEERFPLARDFIRPGFDEIEVVM